MPLAWFYKPAPGKGFPRIKPDLEVQTYLVTPSEDTIWDCPPGDRVPSCPSWMGGSVGNFVLNEAVMCLLLASLLAGTSLLWDPRFLTSKIKGLEPFLQLLTFWIFWMEALPGSLTPFGYLIPEGEIKGSTTMNLIVYLCKVFLI